MSRRKGKIRGGVSTPVIVNPTAPGSFAAVANGGSRQDLTWNASTSGTSIDHYNIYQDGALIGSALGTSFSATGLDGATAYVFSIRAVDKNWNTGSASTTTASWADPTVIGLWDFAESSGPVVDSVNNFSVAAINSPAYSQVLTGGFASTSPGVDCTNGHFYTASVPTALIPGTGDQTIETVVVLPASTSDGILFSTDAAETFNGMEFYLRSSDHTLRGYIASTTGQVVSINIPIPSNYWGNANGIKLRLVLNQTTQEFNVFLAGQELGPVDASTLHTHTITALNLAIGGSAGTSSHGKVKLYKMRFSNNNSNNFGLEDQ